MNVLNEWRQLQNDNFTLQPAEDQQNQESGTKASPCEDINHAQG